MFTFSRKAADKFKIDWKSLRETPGDCWKVDVAKSGRIQILLIVHHWTLATLVRRASDFKTLESIRNEILSHCPWYAAPEAIGVGRNSDRSLDGTINEMKRLADYFEAPHELEKMEESINAAPYSYLSHNKNGLEFPSKALEKYKSDPRSAKPVPPAQRKAKGPILAPKGFSPDQTREIMAAIEVGIWSKRRPPAHLQDQIREGQRITGYTVELFFSRSLWNNPGQRVEEAIAKIQYVKSRDHWRLYWQRASLKWESYPELPIAKTLPQALQAIHQDPYGCFWG